MAEPMTIPRPPSDDAAAAETPAATGAPVAPKTPAWPVLFWRGFTKACGACGQRRGLFHRWVRMEEDCPRCNLHFERSEGHWIGAVGMNTIISFGVLLLGIVIGTMSTYPDIPAVELSIGMAALMLVVPVFLYPISKTLWTAIDMMMRPLEPGEADV